VPLPLTVSCFSQIQIGFTSLALVVPENTHTHAFNGPLSRTTWVSRYQKGKTNLDFTEARVSNEFNATFMIMTLATVVLVAMNS